MLDLYKLKIFELVAETGNFTRTADALFLSQSAISQHIKGLEQDLGTRLFTRGRSGVKLTPEGEMLLVYAQQILDLSATAVNAVTNVANLKEGQLRLGIAVLAGNYMLPAWVNEFRQQYPNLQVLLQPIDRRKMHIALDAGQLDLGFYIGWGVSNKTKLSVQRFRQVTVALIVGKKHNLHDRGQIALKELNGRSVIMRPSHRPAYKWLDALFAEHNVDPDVMLISDELEAIKHAVIESECAAFLPLCTVKKEVAHGDLFVLSVPEIKKQPMVTLAWSRRRPFTPISRAFIAALAKRYPALCPLL